MILKNITIKGDLNTFNKNIFSTGFIQDDHGNVWLSPEAIKLVDSKYTSFELSWDEIPDAKSYVLILIDYDAAKVFGFPFIHWTVANIRNNYLKASANILDKTIIQGVNSGVTKMTEKSKGIFYEMIPSGYRNASFSDSIGFYPLLPQTTPHLYCLRILGIDVDSLDINSGFFLGDLINIAQKHIVGIHNKWFWYKGK